MINTGIELSKILFLDIETVSEKQCFEDLNESYQQLWGKKSKSIGRDNSMELEEISRLYFERAGIFSEFSKVVCISVGFLRKEGSELILRLKSFAGHDEKEILTEFNNLLARGFKDPNRSYLSGHNIKEFDIPFLCRRMMINSIEIPDIINVSGKKPWEIKQFIDTLDLWKFGDLKNYTSLNLLATVLGIESPKDDIDGSQVGTIYWEEQDLERISVYCQKDVKTSVQVFLRMHGLPLLQDEQIEYSAS